MQVSGNVVGEMLIILNNAVLEIRYRPMDPSTAVCLAHHPISGILVAVNQVLEKDQSNTKRAVERAYAAYARLSAWAKLGKIRLTVGMGEALLVPLPTREAPRHTSVMVGPAYIDRSKRRKYSTIKTQEYRLLG